MTPDKLRELRKLVACVSGMDDESDGYLDQIEALIDAELALHSTAEIAGTRAGDVCTVRWIDDSGIWTTECAGEIPPYSDEPYVEHPEPWFDCCPFCGKRVEVKTREQ